MGKSKKQKVEDENRKSIEFYCKYCGHTNTIPVYVEWKICNWCKNKIQNTSRAHFIYKMNKMLKENKSEKN